MSFRALFACIVALAGCADWERGPAPVVPDAGATSEGGATEAGGDGGAALSFETDVLPLLDRCKRCHVAGQEAGDTQLVFTGSASADYATVSKFVDTSAPASSRLLAKMRGQGHEGGTIYAADSPEYMTVLQWIQQGARP
jgi:hypothetical protein